MATPTKLDINLDIDFEQDLKDALRDRLDELDEQENLINRERRRINDTLKTLK